MSNSIYTNKCSCIYCKKELSPRGIHTHYYRTHGSDIEKSKYPSGNNGKYKQISAVAKIAKQQRNSNYLDDPRYCAECNEILPFEKKHNTYCNSSCAAKYNNKHRTPIQREQQRQAIKAHYANKPRQSPGMKHMYSKIHYKTCLCDTEFIARYHTQKYCSSLCKEATVITYRRACKFKINNKDHALLFNGELIAKYGWYAPSNSKSPNLSGVSWDHLYRIEEGFKNKVPAEILSHPANAELVPHDINRKRTQSMITLEQLYDRIATWNAGNHHTLNYFYIDTIK